MRRAARRVGEDLARQREIHGPARLGKRDVERAADDLVDGLPGAQLEIPLRVPGWVLRPWKVIVMASAENVSISSWPRPAASMV